MNQDNIIKNLTPNLLDWFAANARKLPWREHPTPYHVWISEIMLQQTRVEAVKGYYARFLTRYPDIQTLADADPEELAKYWEGLGYYSRMRNLLRCAKLVCDQYDGILPSEYRLLLKLPGVGAYTAGAVASIAYGEPVPAVDGNVLRVISRVFADSSPIDESKTKTACFDLLLRSMPDKPGAFNQALMELGATVCLPNGAPLCETCPVSAFCAARAAGTQLAYPVKKPKKTRRVEEITFLLMQSPQGTLLRKREDAGLLAGLWEYPNLAGALNETQILEYLAERGVQPKRIERLPEKKHIFTHIEWRITGYRIICEQIFPIARERVVSEAEIAKTCAIPTAFDKYPR